MLDLSVFGKLLEKHGAALESKVEEFEIAGHAFHFNRQPYLMGVINLSPDSWYRESVCLHEEQAIERGRMLALQGAHLVDIGAESTLADAVQVNANLQKQKILPVIQGLRKHDILVSVETYEKRVASICFQNGANILNLTGNLQDEEIYHIVAEHEAGVILCYVQGQHVRQVTDFEFAEDIVGTMYEYFAEAIERAVRAGVRRIFIDPGLGFYYRNLRDSSKRVQHQMEVFLHTFRLRQLGWPVCHALPHAFEYFQEEVRCAESFFAVLALLGKTDLLRTHEISKVRPVLRAMNLFHSR